MACFNFLRLLAYVFFYVQLCNIKEAVAAEGKHWALLVAGSNSWGNYRHQVLKLSYIIYIDRRMFFVFLQILIILGLIVP